MCLTFFAFILNFSTEQLTWRDGNISDDLVYVKRGGDHRQGSKKFEFQLANVNRTVVFAIFEAKDTRSNLRVNAADLKDQLEDLQQTTWR